MHITGYKVLRSRLILFNSDLIIPRWTVWFVDDISDYTSFQDKSDLCKPALFSTTALFSVGCIDTLSCCACLFSTDSMGCISSLSFDRRAISSTHVGQPKYIHFQSIDPVLLFADLPQKIVVIDLI